MTKNQDMPSCWEIIKCGREQGGKGVGEFGECVASQEGMGHSCWVVAGTLCQGEVQGTVAQKIRFCTGCKVYGMYNRINGEKGGKIASVFPREEEKYMRQMIVWLNTGTRRG